MNPLTQSKNATILPVLIALTLGCFALSPQARAVCQEGCLTNENTALGDDALLNNTNGLENTATGAFALSANTTGLSNTATGYYALFSNTVGNSNTAIGVLALQMNTAGNNNTATGVQALQVSFTGNNNTATGAGALKDNYGSENTATGGLAMFHNNVGSSNTATGFGALGNNRTGNGNTATGFNALIGNESGGQNTAIGYNALRHNVTGRDNIAVGALAGLNLTRGDNNIDIGNVGARDERATIRIGTEGTQTSTFVAGISGTTIAGGVAVVVDTDGHLGTTTSSKRFKDEIRPMDKASETILVLKPVTFRYKHDFDPEGIPQFGLVAEDVEKVNPDLVVRDEQGKPYTVRYDAVNAMLLNEFIKARRQIDSQQKQIEALTAGLQKVSSQLEASRSAPQTVLNNQ